jgi:hypothetical protein
MAELIDRLPEMMRHQQDNADKRSCDIARAAVLCIREHG